jgi:actin-related protein
MPGFTERMAKEMKALVPPGKRARIVDSGSYQMFAAWVGGSILASLSTFHPCWITKQNYDEFGPSIM